MATLRSEVFFYGLFMDAAVLEAKGISSPTGRPAVVRDWALRIGHRATLAPDAGRSVHGVLTSLPLPDLDRLYAEASVRMYRPVAVLVETEAAAVPALAYVLPEPPAPDERNPDYAAKLRALAERLGFPREYTMSIA
jgi:Gamma-glutamyl cyclotransferase, AIG2-like